MKICPSCGRENGDNRDFCECGEYLRWEPTQHVATVKPPAAGEAHESAGAANGPGPSPAALTSRGSDPELTLAPGALPSVPAAAARSAPGQAPAGQARADPQPGAATLLLRRPEDEGAAEGPVTISVKPGERATLLALIRNESGIVDNYDLSVSGMPPGWATVTPATAYLVPYGSSGNYEQEIQIHLHPPRAPEAQARAWALEVVATSRAYQAPVATAPATMQVLPYEEVVTKLAPDRASGRLKARLLLTIRNRANAPVQVLVSAEDGDGECQFRFAQPSVTIDPGQAVEAPFTVFPPKQIWIGRPKDRPIRVIAAPAGTEKPVPMPAIFRQRPWLPWWLSVLAPILAAVIAAVVLLTPKQTVVPDLKKAKGVPQAQVLLAAAGLKLSAQMGRATVAGATPGAIVSQFPVAGKKVKKGAVVSVTVDVASGEVKVPALGGLTPVAADTTLRGLGLSLGAVSPQLSPDGKIATQIPQAGDTVKIGTPIEVFMAPKLTAKQAAAAAAAAAAVAAGAKVATPGASGSSSGASSAAAGAQPNAGRGAAIVIPAVTGTAAVAMQKLSQVRLVPSTKSEISTAPAGSLIGTSPAAGSSVAAGSPVTLLVSAGFPQLALDNGRQIQIVDGASGKTAVKFPVSSAPQSKPAWSPDGNLLAYIDGGQLMLLDLSQKGAAPRALTPAGSDDDDPSFAPTGNATIIAFISRAGSGADKLCFATIGPNPINPDCTTHPGFDLGREIDWSPDGTRLLVYGSPVGNVGSTFGLIQFLSNLPSSSHAADWGHGTVVTDTSRSGQGIAYGAFSPDGKTVAMVSNIGTLDFHVVLRPSNGFGLRGASVLAVRGCQVSWRSDGAELAVMQADSGCMAQTGDIAVIDPKDAQRADTIATVGADPAWRPLSLGG